MDKTSLVLLPEIALTTQVMNIFKSRFGDKVAVLHSALSAGERCDEWAASSKARPGWCSARGPRCSRRFRTLALVVVDEEHEDSYKQDTQPRYHGRETARRRAVAAGAALVLGSATPSIESYYLAKQGEYRLIEMTSRVEGARCRGCSSPTFAKAMPTASRQYSAICWRNAITARLARREQVILFQNRRAYSTFLLCRDCGFVTRCPNCAVSLKFHSAQKKLSCHHCNYACVAPDVCPSCGSTRIGRFGIGTERVEEEAGKLFPEARILRMDRDTTSRKGSHDAILALSGGAKPTSWSARR